jgi:hypothetical protein
MQQLLRKITFTYVEYTSTFRIDHRSLAEDAPRVYMSVLNPAGRERNIQATRHGWRKIRLNSSNVFTHQSNITSFTTQGFIVHFNPLYLRKTEHGISVQWQIPVETRGFAQIGTQFGHDEIRQFSDWKSIFHFPLARQLRAISNDRKWSFTIASRNSSGHCLRGNDTLMQTFLFAHDNVSFDEELRKSFMSYIKSCTCMPSLLIKTKFNVINRDRYLWPQKDRYAKRMQYESIVRLHLHLIACKLRETY